MIVRQFTTLPAIKVTKGEAVKRKCRLGMRDSRGLERLRILVGKLLRKVRGRANFRTALVGSDSVLAILPVGEMVIGR